MVGNPARTAGSGTQDQPSLLQLSCTQAIKNFLAKSAFLG